MKKLTLFVASILLIQVAFAGGLLTNTNQSAQFIRMLSRNASTDIDAVYFNPAGLVQLEDGWHFAFYSQTIFQNKTVNSGFPLLNNGLYEGEVKVPVFPTAFGVYKKDKLAISLGFGPNGGGGSAEFARGLPSFEIPITKVVPGLAGLSQISPSMAVSGYDADLQFSGSSVFWGIQLGASYKLSEAFSVYGGVRYLPAKNSYEGSIKNVQLEVGGSKYNAAEWLTQSAGTISGLATQAGAGAQSLQPIIDAGVGNASLDALLAVGAIDAATKAQIEQGLAALGGSATGKSVIEIQQTFAGTQALLAGTAGQLNGTAAQLGDKNVKTEQTGTGITPMIGVNISPAEGINIAVKYEMKTKLELTNSTEVDDLGLFPDGGTSRSDIPAILAVGVGYRPSSKFEAQLSYNMYFDKGVDWGKNTRDLAIWQSVDPSKIRSRGIDKNGFELGLGLEFNLSDNFAISVGGLRSKSGIADSYQSDFSYSNASYTGGLGFMWKITDQITFDAGFSDTFYKDATVSFTDPDLGNYNETLGKTTINFAAGLSFSIF